MSAKSELAEWARKRIERQDLPFKLLRDGERRMATHVFRRGGVQTRIARAKKACKLMPLDQLRGLPSANEKSTRSALYFLWHGPILHYIGQSIRVGSRLKDHRRTGKKFTHATMMPTPAEYLRTIERQYIFYYLPPGNAAL